MSYMCRGGARRRAVRAWVLLVCASLVVASLVTLVAVGAPAAWATTPTGFQDNPVITGLTQPTSVQFAPDVRLFVAEKGGLIKVYDGPSDPTPTVFANLATNVDNFWDRGLLGLALDPSFSSGRPYVYALYTYDAPIGGTAPVWNDRCPNPPGATTDGCVVSGRLVRLTAGSGGSATGPEQVLINDWCQQFPSHSIGSLAFGQDSKLYVSGGDGASFGFADYGQQGDPCGDPPGRVGDNLTPPAAAGGALRSQSPRRASTQPVTLDGGLLRLDPDTGQAAAGNPFASSTNTNKRRIVAYGTRNPFRFTIRPGTSELWVGDVDWGTWEEVNRVNPLQTGGTNLGWPCYEDRDRQGGYDGANLALCESLYTTAGTGAPYYAYKHGVQVVPNETCPTNTGSSISGLAFYDRAHRGGNYPAQYDSALFFADHSRNCIWAMLKGTNGLPDIGRIVTFVTNAGGPVDLKIGPGGDLYYVGFDDGAIHRISYVGADTPPNAVATATPSSGPAPLTVQFDGSGSNDPDPGDRIASYSWDLDGDGTFGDSTAVRPAPVTFGTRGMHTASLRVTDTRGAASTTSVQVTVDGPVPMIETPSSSLRWRVGDTVSFSGSATDAQDGTLPASGLSWEVVMHHCTATGCHTHPVQTFSGVASGSFPAPDHEYPSYLEMKLTARDSSGLTATTSRRLDPQTVNLSFTTQPPGLRVATFDATLITPFTRTVIVGSSNSISAPNQKAGDTTYTFQSWSDGGAQTHNITATATPTTYTATFTTGPAVPRSMVAAAGTDGAGWVRREDARWRSISGKVVGPPAVVSVRGQAYHIVASTDNNLWVRTDLTRWATLAPAGTFCQQPGATVVGSTLWVGCRGRDGSLMVGTAPIGSGGLPRVSTWTSYGGRLAAGPGVAVVGGTVRFAATGIDSQLYMRTQQSGWVRPFVTTCVDRPALGSFGPAAWVGCHGPRDVLLFTSWTGSGWAPVRSVAGPVAAGPGLAVRPDGTADAYAQTTAGAVSVNRLTGQGALGWRPLGGVVVGGVQGAEVVTP